MIGYVCKMATLADGTIRISVDFPEASSSEFIGSGLWKVGTCVDVMSSDDGISGPPPRAKEPNKLAEKLYKSGYFTQKKLLNAMDEKLLYTRSEHLKQIQSLSCCHRSLSMAGACNGDVVAHHVNYGNEGGMGIKGDDFFTIPLCHAHHSELHQKGINRELQQKVAVRITTELVKSIFLHESSLNSLSEVTVAHVDYFEVRLYADQSERQ